MKFLCVALKKRNDEYQVKLKEGVCSEKVIMQLAWNVKDLSGLNEHGRRLITESDDIKQKMHDPVYDKVFNNFAKKLSSFCESIKEFVKSHKVEAYTSQSHSGSYEKSRRAYH